VLVGAASSPRYDAHHMRRIAFVDDAYWIFEDRLSASEPHHYDARWHLAPEAFGRLELDRDRSAARAPGIALVFAAGVDLTVEQGWYAPSYGIRHPAPVVSAAVEGVNDAVLWTVAVPVNASDPWPALRVLAADDSGTTVEVSRGQRVDRIAFPADVAAAGWWRPEESRW
jgi:hypothetical protein